MPLIHPPRKRIQLVLHSPAAHGNTRNETSLPAGEILAKIRSASDREILPEQATIDLIMKGCWDLEDIGENAPTI
jgi:hypothetical protein